MNALPNPETMTHAERVALTASLQPTRWRVRHVPSPAERIAMWRASVTTRSDYSHLIESHRAARGLAWIASLARRPIPRHRALVVQ